MPIYFLDSSAIVKRYVSETGTAWVLNLHKPSAQNIIYVAQITGVEVVSAISRRLRGNKLIQKSADKAIFRFKRDFANKLRIVRLNDQIISEAMQLSEKHFLRGYDAVQLAIALELERRFAVSGFASITFISADNALNASAQSEGLTIDNPNNYP
jgi:uncharacterized protein